MQRSMKRKEKVCTRCRLGLCRQRDSQLKRCPLFADAPAKGERLMSELMRQECYVAAHIVSLKHFMKARIFQQRGHMMSESEGMCLQSRFSAVTWMECVDHSFRLASDCLMSKTAEAALCRCFAVSQTVAGVCTSASRRCARFTQRVVASMGCCFVRRT